MENKYLYVYVIIIKITLYAPFQHLKTLNADCVQMLLSHTLTDNGIHIFCRDYWNLGNVVNFGFHNFHPSTFNLLISFWIVYVQEYISVFDMRY